MLAQEIARDADIAIGKICRVLDFVIRTFVGRLKILARQRTADRFLTLFPAADCANFALNAGTMPLFAAGPADRARHASSIEAG